MRSRRVRRTRPWPSGPQQGNPLLSSLQPRRCPTAEQMQLQHCMHARLRRCKTRWNVSPPWLVAVRA